MRTSRASRLLGAALASLVLTATGGLATPSTAATSTPSAVSGRSFSTDHLPQWWYDAMGLAKVQRQWTGKGVKIAVIDGAVDTRVPDLRGADITLHTDCLDQPVRNRAGDFANHGLGMLEFLVGQGRGTGPGGKGILGVAPEASVDYWSMNSPPTKDLAGCDVFNSGRFLVDAARGGADIISISIGELNPEWNKYVAQAQQLGAVVVAASGEDGGDGTGFVYPARSPGAVAVYALNKEARAWPENPSADDTKSIVAPDLAYPTMSAPGVDTQTGGFDSSGRYSSLGSSTGTSNATPLVAGALALVKQKYPEATNNQLVQNLIHNSGGFSMRGFAYDDTFGFGTVQVANMLADDPTKWPDVNPLVGDPQKTLKEFPLSVYGKPAASSASAQQAGDGKAGSAASDAATTTDGGSGGVPVWVWPLVAVVVLAGAAGGLVLRRRTSPADGGSVETVSEHDEGDR